MNDTVIELTRQTRDRSFVSVDSKAEAICESLVTSPLMIGEIDSVRPFDRSLLGSVPRGVELNFNQKLGHLYEHALGVLIEASDQLFMVAQNLQIFDSDGRTIGELDFVVQDVESGRYLHLELAIKFYIAVQGSKGWKFPGPDPKDNWSRKLDRMRRHQWQICQRPETRAILHERFGIQSISTEHLVCGRVFYPHQLGEAPLPEHMLATASRGRWLYLSDFEKRFCHVDEVHLIEKPLWPVDPVLLGIDHYSLVATDLLKARASERCVMFCLPESGETWFLVPNAWPDFD